MEKRGFGACVGAAKLRLPQRAVDRLAVPYFSSLFLQRIGSFACEAYCRAQ